LILANKQDLGGALSFEEISNSLGLDEEDIAGRHCSVTGCSAMTGEGIETGIDWIVQDIVARIFIMA
jgi:ADP-ribosylation factor-like protein 2